MNVILGIFIVLSFAICGYVIYTMIKEGKRKKSRTRRR